jgi:Flp pilus assembly protein protease CpaA
VPPFFPNLAFAWTFYGVLVLLLTLAAVIDLRRVIVPKWLSLSTLAVGVVFQLARGAWLGAEGRETWFLGRNGALIGAADGFLFALAGFAAGFAIFFLLWIIGGCGGGDVKLFAALSAWVGPEIAIWILVLSTIILIVLVFLRGGQAILSQSPKALPVSRTDKRGKAAVPTAPKPSRGLTYSLPLALATALVLLWFFRFDLNLARPDAAQQGATWGLKHNPPRDWA